MCEEGGCNSKESGCHVTMMNDLLKKYCRISTLKSRNSRIVYDDNHKCTRRVVTFIHKNLLSSS